MTPQPKLVFIGAIVALILAALLLSRCERKENIEIGRTVERAEQSQEILDRVEKRQSLEDTRRVSGGSTRDFDICMQLGNPAAFCQRFLPPADPAP